MLLPLLRLVQRALNRDHRLGNLDINSPERERKGRETEMIRNGRPKNRNDTFLTEI